MVTMQRQFLRRADRETLFGAISITNRTAGKFRCFRTMKKYEQRESLFTDYFLRRDKNRQCADHEQQRCERTGWLSL